MADQDRGADEAAVRALIGRHFDGLRWSPGIAPDWQRFSADFLPRAALVPAARPAQARTLAAFIDRMNGVAQGTLHSFEERTLGLRVMIVGAVAVVLAASEMVKNGAEVDHDVSGYLLVRSEGRWQIAAHAWDHAGAANPVPPALR